MNNYYRTTFVLVWEWKWIIFTKESLNICLQYIDMGLVRGHRKILKFTKWVDTTAFFQLKFMIKLKQLIILQPIEHYKTYIILITYHLFKRKVCRFATEGKRGRQISTFCQGWWAFFPLASYLSEFVTFYKRHSKILKCLHAIHQPRLQII